MDTPLSHQMNLSETRWKQVTMTPIWSSFIWHFSPNEWNERSVVVAAVAQKEEEALNRWKETQRVPSVRVNPERLGNLFLPSTTFTTIFIFTSSLTFGILIFYPGGDVTLAEVRQKQQINHQSMKLQKKVHVKLFTLETIHVFSVELYIYLNITANYLHIPFLFAAINKKKRKEADSAWKHAMFEMQ